MTKEQLLNYCKTNEEKEAVNKMRNSKALKECTTEEDARKLIEKKTKETTKKKSVKPNFSNDIITKINYLKDIHATDQDITKHLDKLVKAHEDKELQLADTIKAYREKQNK